MKFLAYFRSLAARFFHRSETETELEEELRTHIKLCADDLERSGMDERPGPILLFASDFARATVSY